jgi:nucleotide-binding universal stress UspA family protein
MMTHPVAPITILAAVDYSDTSSLVVEQAVAMARREQSVELHFLHVNHGRPNDDDEREARRTELLEWLGARLKSEGVPSSAKVVGHEATGDAAHVIVEMASDLHADNVVIGTHGRRGVRRMVMGSVSESVVKNCGCPVLVVRRKAHHENYPRIEPPCPQCVETRTQTGGNQFWCDHHLEKHGRRHTYYSTGLASWVSQRMTP